MSAETLIGDLNELARAKLEESAVCTAVANSFIQCVKLVNQHLPILTPPILTGSRPTSTPPAANPQSPDPDILPNRHRTKGPVFAIMRERRDWIMEEEIGAELQNQGVPFVIETVRSVLAEGVRDGKLDRRGNAYRVVPINQVLS
jgi:hypothetical protein